METTQKDREAMTPEERGAAHNRLYKAAEARIRELFPTEAPEDRWGRRYCMAEWGTCAEWWIYLATAPEEEIRAMVGKVPTADERPELYE